MLKSQSSKIISKLLMQKEEIVFVYLFGSSVSGKKRYGSDLDVAIYFSITPDLMSIGELVLKLEEETEQKIDLVKLNNLDKTNPALAYSVLSSGILIFNKDESLFKKYKRSVILNYLDFDYTKKLLDKAFSKRLSTNNFAVFDK